MSWNDWVGYRLFALYLYTKWNHFHQTNALPSEHLQWCSESSVVPTTLAISLWRDRSRSEFVFRSIHLEVGTESVWILQDSSREVRWSSFMISKKSILSFIYKKSILLDKALKRGLETVMTIPPSDLRFDTEHLLYSSILKQKRFQVDIQYIYIYIYIYISWIYIDSSSVEASALVD